MSFGRTYGCEGKGCSIDCFMDASKVSQVIYGKDQLEETIKILRPVLDCLEPIVCVANNQIRFLIFAQVWNSLNSISYLYKSSAYRYEQEVRVVALRSEIKDEDIQLDYRETASGSPQLRHYIEKSELHVDKIMQSGSVVTIGPCVPFAENMRRNLEKLAKESGMGGRPEFRISRISYRSS